MDAHSFIHGLQITDTFFPVGAFAYSDGLETAAAGDLVHDAASLAEWMSHFLEAVFVPCEGLALAKCMRATREGDIATLHQLDEELTAIRPSKAVRSSSSGVGKRLLSLYSATYGDEDLPALPHGNAAAAYGMVYFRRGLCERDALLAYGYNRLTGIVSAALRLISIGHVEGQAVLTAALDRLPAAVERILEGIDEPLHAFSPVLDIQQMNHQYIYSRLFRS